MASSTAHDGDRLEEMWRRLSLLEEEEGVIVPKSHTTSKGKEMEFQYCLIGRIHTDCFFNVLAMKKTMAAVWRPLRGMFIREIGENVFFVPVLS